LRSFFNNNSWGKRIGWLEISFLILIVAALAIRLWELGGRAMHYDEAIHLHYAWKLSNMGEFIHSPWMHGPFQVEFVAFIFSVFGDTDFTSRLGYVLFGVALVASPYLLRQHLGRVGLLFAGVMLTVSPTLLYFSRFGRNDIIMAFWATALLVMLWRYSHDQKDRYLYIASAVLALMFATKETAYFIVLIFGALAFFLAIPQITPLVFRRAQISQLTGPAAFFLLIFTLTLPQWSSIAGLFQGLFGLTLVNPDGVAGGIVGAPQWTAPLVILPVYSPPVWVHAVAPMLLIAVLLWTIRAHGWSAKSLFSGVVAPLAASAALVMAMYRPLGRFMAPENPPFWVDLPIAGALSVIAIVILLIQSHPRIRSLALILGLAALTLIYAALLTPVINVGSVVHNVLPSGIQIDTSLNGIPVNFIVAGSILIIALTVSALLGLAWRRRVWLVCATIFYSIWLTLYTTVFTNWVGAFSGVWQGMGYWIAQQEVARGNQPWYYYFVGLSVYEILPVVFGVIGAVYFFKKADIFGLALVAWAGLSLLAYTIASEKMPWLLVNITLPFILLSGKYLGELAERVSWRDAIAHGTVFLLILTPIAIVGGIYSLSHYLNFGADFSTINLLVLIGVAAVTISCALLIRLSNSRSGPALVGLSTAALLLAFGTWTAFRAAYTFDDSHPEILVYAQGSADLPQTYRDLQKNVLLTTSDSAVKVDYDLWYPFQWYVRDESSTGTLNYACFKDEREDGWNDGCNPASESEGSTALLLTANHISYGTQFLRGHEKSEPLRNLLWFPESYRRPAEDRQSEGPIEELSKDFTFFRDSASSREAWRGVINYILFRDLKRDWYSSEYYSYIRK
jgi:predicted membrane-bound mannosyltransferase